MTTPQPDSVTLRRARSTGEGFVNTRMFAFLSRAGFVARALIYGIIGLLAFDLVIGHGGKITNQQGALRTVEQQPFGHLLLALLAIGLGGYAIWRLFRAFLGHGREGSDSGLERVGALGSGIVYAVLCVVAIQILLGPGTSGSNSKKTASDVFGWPAGRWLVGVAGIVVACVAIYQFVRGVRQKFLDDSKIEQMSYGVETWFRILGTIGHVARAVIFGIIAVFLLKASYDYKANEAIGLDGALAKIYNAAYGSWLLGAVAAGLIVFACFSLVEARYRRI
ncbi:MAG TPA: DUF1206 domain-containing protein [Gaiellaceae bacterium]